jgi:DNA-binding helix-hairpin-helix protein with protein kinase domain
VPVSMYDGSGRPVLFGRELGKGGEGYVREVAGDPRTVAKVFHAVPPPLKVEKLSLLPSLATPDLLSVSAWPTGILAERPGGNLRGILLPRVAGREIHFIYSPAQRRQHFPKSDWSFLVHVAMNAAAAVETIHSDGYVIGDLNQGGFFVSDDGTVRLIDCDSFQIKHNGRIYRCDVRVPHYTPPELQAADLKKIDATVEHDSFGLGVLVFHLLFMGRHPFAGRYLGAGDMPIERAISERRFAFSDARLSYQMDVPPYAPTLQLVPPRLANLFERAFRGEAQNRPLASEWYGQLRSLKSSLRKCANGQSHVFSVHLTDCPWCELERAGVPPLFILETVTFDFDSGFDLPVFWREVEQLADIPDQDSFLAALSPARAQLNELPADSKYRALGPVETPPAMPVLELLSSPEIPIFHARPPASDPRSGYTSDDEPALPEFMPETLPPERMIELLPVPAPPAVKAVNYMAAPRERYDKLRRYWEYRTVKFGTIALTTSAAYLYFTSTTTAPSLVALFLAAALAVAWLAIWLRYHRELSANLKAAQVAQAKADAKVAEINRVHAAQRERIEEINRERRVEYSHYQLERDRMRSELPQVNEQKHRRWLEQCHAIEQQRESIRARNRARLKEWADRAHRQEAELRRQWEIDVARVRAQRQAIDEENQRRRRLWELSLPQHNAMVHAITEMNRRRNEARERYEQELRRREAEVHVAEQKLQHILQRWDAERAAASRDLTQTRNDLASARQRYSWLKTTFERERDELLWDLRQAQLDEYLRQQTIHSARISGLGQKRKDTLLAFGIETAFDITERRLTVVNGQGFGPKLLNALEAWRAERERSFVFNSPKQIASPRLRNLHMKYQTERASLSSALRSGLNKGKSIVASAARRQQELRPEAQNALSAVVQAKASLNLAQRYAQ